MQIIKYPPRESWNGLTERPTQSLETIEQKVLPVLQDVKLNGDEALRHYSKLFDGVELIDFSVSAEDMNQALSSVSEELKQAINTAYRNIHTFHQQQLQSLFLPIAHGFDECGR